jgi:DNA invertase Pin-like site-specific DNA recombinase
MNELIPVAVYYRMSDDRQENSIDRQRSQVVPLAQKKHYHIVVEPYIDEGITGSEIARRPAFQRMLRDAQAGKFQGIICDDIDRFGRFDSIDAGEIIAPLRRKGIWLETVAQGRIDWDSFSGRITDAVLREAKNLEQQAISRRVLSTQVLMAQAGKDTGGRLLYGYRWDPPPVEQEYKDKHGKTVIKLVKVPGAKRVPDGLKAEAVRLLFTLYDQGWTLFALSEELHRRAVPSPNGKPRWTRSVIQRLLRNRRYVGDLVWGVHAAGKRHRFVEGQLRPTARTDKIQIVNASETWVVRPRAHESLVDRDLFERVQARLKGNQVCTTPHPQGGSFVLSRLLACGHCGSSLIGITQGKHRYYVCHGYLAYGKTYCKRNTVSEQSLLTVIIGKLRETFLNPDRLNQLRVEMAALEAQLRSNDNLNQLRQRYNELDRQIDKGNENLALLPADRIAGVCAKIRQWEQERDAVQAELKQIKTQSPVQKLEQQIKLAESALWRLQEALKAKNYPLLREVLRGELSRVTLYWTHHTTNKLTRCKLARGEMCLRSTEELSELFPSANQ